MQRSPDNPRKALGKGLSSLLPGKSITTTVVLPTAPRPGFLEVPVSAIAANPVQPRTVFNNERLQELSQSIAAHGVIQPLIVRRKGDRYELVAGERRWRAAEMAGLDKIPVVVQDLVDGELLEVSLIENIQREDLNPVEVAQAFDRLAREHGLSHDEIADRTGKNRTTVTNMLRLLRLPPDVLLLVAEHRISMGHARAILGLPTPELQRQVAEKTASQGLSVRQVERAVQKMTETRETKTIDEVQAVDPNIKAAIAQLESLLGTRVRVVEKSPERGRIEIEYYSQDDLHRIYTVITREE